MSSAAFAYPAKSAEAFRTISEVAVELDVPQHVLRFWESRFAQVRPVKRAGGRRYYRPDDIDLLKGIRALLYGDGFTIKGVQKVLKERGLRHVAQIGRGETPDAAPPEPQVIEKIVYVEKPAEAAPKPAPARKRAPHLRAVPGTLSLPFFDMPEPAPAFAETIAVLDAAPEAPTPEEAPIPQPGLAPEAHARLEALLDELAALKLRLQAVYPSQR